MSRRSTSYRAQAVQAVLFGSVLLGIAVLSIQNIPSSLEVDPEAESFDGFPQTWSCGEVVHAAIPPLEPPGEERARGHTFSNFAHWLVPGRVMVGRYPYVEPTHRCSSQEQGDKQLERILEAGVSAFVSLQHELPPQELVPKEGAGGGFLPYYGAVLSAWSKGGSRRARAEARGLRPTFQHYPIQDYSAPQHPVLRQVLDNVLRLVERGHVVYVHCWSGRGRAGTVGAALLALLYRQLEGPEVLRTVQELYNTRGDPPEHLSPETEGQRYLVLNFTAHLRKAECPEGTRPAAGRRLAADAVLLGSVGSYNATTADSEHTANSSMWDGEGGGSQDGGKVHTWAAPGTPGRTHGLGQTTWASQVAVVASAVAGGA